MLLHRIGRDYGEWDLDLLADRMSVPLLREFLAFYRLELRELERERRRAERG